MTGDGGGGVCNKYLEAEFELYSLPEKPPPKKNTTSYSRETLALGSENSPAEYITYV